MEQVASIICGDLASSNQETIGQLDFRCGPLSYDCPLHLQVTSYKIFRVWPSLKTNNLTATEFSNLFQS